MKFSRLLILLWALVLGAGSGTQAQTAAPAGAPGASSTSDYYALVAAGQASRYTAAYDSLMRLVADIHTRTEARMAYFKAAHGTFNGLHSRTRASTGISGPVVKRHKEKQLFGTTLQKVRYYDEKGRKVLSERYVGNRLTSLKLLEYDDKFVAPTAKWVFAKGDYLEYITQPKSSLRQASYYVKSRPATTE